MAKEHIIDILDNRSLSSLAESEIKTIRSHVEGCPNCLRAFEAAQVSSLLIRERAAETIDPSPFFQTRVLAALREKQANVPAWVRLWKSAGVLVSSMAVTTAALAALSFFVPGAGTDAQRDTTAALVPYSAEAVVLDQNQDDDQMTDAQVLNTIYVDDEDR